MELVYTVEEAPLGTGGAVRLAMAQCRQDHVFVFNGDTYLDLEIDAVEQQWQSRREPIIVGREVPDTARYGRLDTDGARVTGFAEKGASGPGLINGGTYVLNRGQLDGFALHQAFSLETEYLVPQLAHRPFDLFVTAGHFIDIGVPEDFARAQTELAGC
jgi:D-glycero-alpha-D-manno-heptose 1-phosphate guanylyltransferase